MLILIFCLSLLLIISFLVLYLKQRKIKKIKKRKEGLSFVNISDLEEDLPAYLDSIKFINMYDDVVFKKYDNVKVAEGYHGITLCVKVTDECRCFNEKNNVTITWFENSYKRRREYYYREHDCASEKVICTNCNKIIGEVVKVFTNAISLSGRRDHLNEDVFELRIN